MGTQIDHWEDEHGRRAARRFCEEARERLRCGTWRASDVEAGIERLERTLSWRQQELLWHHITGDAELAELMAHIGG